MGKQYDSIDENIQRWMARQKMFFVGSAPLAGDGLINISPKGHDALRVLDERTLAYLDFGGSGAETIAHIRENGRIVIMMCAFDGPPKIFRFYGHGEIITPLDNAFAELAAGFEVPGVGTRAIIKIHVERIQDSCGYGIPNYDFTGHRDSSQNWLKTHDVASIRDYQVAKNLNSLDGLPAMTEDEARAFKWPEVAGEEDGQA